MTPFANPFRHCRHPLLTSLVTIVLSLLIPSCQPQPKQIVHRIILISIDTLRADHLGTYGSERATSPHLDALANHGVVFEDASTTAPWTLPAHSSILTGFYPAQTGMRTAKDILRKDVPTIAEALQAAGYHTSGIGNVIYLDPMFELNRGFETWKFLPADETPKGAASRITEFGMKFLEENSAQPCFLFLHYFDVHSPYLSQPAFERAFLPPDFRQKSRVTGATLQLGLAGLGKFGINAREREDLKKLYDAGILQLDNELGRFFRFIDERFGFEDTLIIVTADHGEAFFEHGKFSHGSDQYQEQLHVPLILRGGPVPAGLRFDQPVSLIDLAPTILGAAHVSPEAALPGVDLAHYWENPANTADDRVLFAQSAPGVRGNSIQMVRRGRFKLITNRKTGKRELYDLTTDPTEQNNLSETHPDEANALSTRIDTFFLQHENQTPSPHIDLEPATIERLRKLGYVE